MSENIAISTTELRRAVVANCEPTHNGLRWLWRHHRHFVRAGEEIRIPIPHSLARLDHEPLGEEYVIPQARIVATHNPNTGEIEWLYNGTVRVTADECLEERRITAWRNAALERDRLRAILEQSLYIGSWTSDQLAAWEKERDEILTPPPSGSVESSD